jgi:hypothetical protein
MISHEEILTKHELFMWQAPCWNFELDEKQLLKEALKVGFVTKVDDNQYKINHDYNKEE